MFTRFARPAAAAAAVVLGCMLFASPALAATNPAAAQHKAPTAQQQRMANCNKQARGKHGAAHKAFMKSCLSDKNSHAMNSSQQRMKTCNAEARSKSLKGAARKTFMSSCLKTHH
ncbi:MAG: PsiF family protein [Rhodanobacteraceae bacterium]